MAKAKAKKRVDAWVKLMGQLSPQTRCHLEGSATAEKPGEDSDFQNFRADLSPATAAIINSIGEVPDGWSESVVQPRHCLIICPDGGTPVLQQVINPLSLAARLQELDGDDVYAFPFFGIPCPISKEPGRVVLLPDDTALPFDAEHAPDLEDEDVDIQEDFYLGPEELVIPMRVDEEDAEDDED